MFPILRISSALQIVRCHSKTRTSHLISSSQRFQSINIHWRQQSIEKEPNGRKKQVARCKTRPSATTILWKNKILWTILASLKISRSIQLVSRPLACKRIMSRKITRSRLNVLSRNRNRKGKLPSKIKPSTLLCQQTHPPKPQKKPNAVRKIVPRKRCTQKPSTYNRKTCSSTLRLASPKSRL